MFLSQSKIYFKSLIIEVVMSSVYFFAKNLTFCLLCGPYPWELFSVIERKSLQRVFTFVKWRSQMTYPTQSSQKVVDCWWVL